MISNERDSLLMNAVLNLVKTNKLNPAHISVLEDHTPIFIISFPEYGCHTTQNCWIQTTILTPIYINEFISFGSRKYKIVESRRIMYTAVIYCIWHRCNVIAKPMHSEYHYNREMQYKLYQFAFAALMVQKT